MACSAIAVALHLGGPPRAHKVLRGAAVVAPRGGDLLWRFSSRGYVDVTEDRRNSFNPADEQAFRAMPGELVVTAYAGAERLTPP